MMTMHVTSNKDRFLWLKFAVERSKKSIQCRMQTIEKAVRKLHACIRYCEFRRPSGASNDDIVICTSQSNAEGRSKFQKGVDWNLFGILLKFSRSLKMVLTAQNKHQGHMSLDILRNLINQSPNQTSPSLSSFYLNLDDDDVMSGGSPSPGPVGMKKFKLKRKMDEQTSTIVNTIKEENKQLLEQLKKTSE
ncbi:hypothetical protein Ccrd_025186 [Cynara cardunculus var. scolymus]|uniref:Uncharacterized protein n=1 Tax=Cynara cardunculus var. scolymus TaxID=59895 RepID=A0A103XB91_CYNCS|nr:hypothetical protein Ccrd_025186 [Cynara cardunculus var. scolymus]